MQIIEVPISKVKNWKHNPRSIHEKDFKRLQKQLKEYKQFKPLICFKQNGSYITLGGNMRLRAMQKLGFQKVAVVEVEAKTKKERIKLSLIDNDRSGYYDDQALAELIYPFKDELSLKDFKVDLKIPDMDLGNVLDRYAPSTEKDDEIPVVKKTKIKLGDMFELGRHRLLCGDATKKEDVERLMDGKKADMVFTDPPYGIDLDTDYSQIKSGMVKKGKGSKFKKVIGDNIEYNPNHVFKDFGYCNEIILFGADYFAEKLFQKNNGSWFVWDKRLSDNRDKLYGSSFELIWSKAKHKRDIVRILWAGLFGLNTQDEKKRIHPTQKPIQLCEWFIGKFSNRDAIVIDLFLGSGSTLIACEKLNRICYGTEIDPQYCQVIIDRWQNYTNQKAVKVG